MSMNRILTAVVVCAVAAGCVVTPAAAVCSGDCGGAGAVTIDDLIVGVNIALGAAAVACFACRHWGRMKGGGLLDLLDPGFDAFVKLHLDHEREEVA